MIYLEDLEESFYLSKRFKKIEQLVKNELQPSLPLSKYKIFKNRLSIFKRKIKNILTHNKERDNCPLNNSLIDEINKRNNKFIMYYYKNFLKNDNTIFHISIKSFLYSTLLILMGKIIGDLPPTDKIFNDIIDLFIFMIK